MTPVSRPPIFCDDCATLALATLDDAPLCADCLQALLDKGDVRLVERIAPLHFDFGLRSGEISMGFGLKP